MTVPKLLNNVKFLQKCIVVDDKGRILALRRDPNDARRPNCWDLPGGHYEKGEDVNQSLKREIMEETSLTALSLRPIYIASSMGITYENITVFALTQLCTKWEGDIKISDEHVEYKWVTVNEFMDLETGDDGGFLKDSINAYLRSLHSGSIW